MNIIKTIAETTYSAERTFHSNVEVIAKNIIRECPATSDEWAKTYAVRWMIATGKR
jgi:hypothetical protein